MVAFVTVMEQKEYSRIQHDALDMTIATVIEAKSAAVQNYLKDTSPYEATEEVDSGFDSGSSFDSVGGGVARAEVKLAVLVEVDRILNLKKNPMEAQTNYLSDAATALLYPLRDPALR